jgi:NhaA family Na+:H+ antiporter
LVFGIDHRTNILGWDVFCQSSKGIALLLFFFQIMRVTALFKDFVESEKSGGIMLIFCTVFSLVMANSAWHDSYHNIWSAIIGGHSIEHWINDGLMAIFFLLIGLELEREVYIGELSTLKKAALPLVGALGGMLVPAAIYFAFNRNTPGAAGVGIPMATDIAFALGILSLLGQRVPIALKVFLTALAVIDDLGAIVVIAVFYTKELAWQNLLVALAIFAVLLVLNRRKVHVLWPYLVGGVFMWYFMLHSGVHATITGVLLAFAIPFADGTHDSISYKLQHFLHRPVAFFILPLFALANTAIVFQGSLSNALMEFTSVGIMAGLVIGKPLGITLFSFMAVALRWCQMPSGVQFKQLFGAGILGGIGFTMSIFVTLLAFDANEVINASKLAILCASTMAGVCGYVFLHWALPKNSAETAVDLNNSETAPVDQI